MFGNFMDFVRRSMEGSICEDQAYKNYDLLYRANDKRLRQALTDLGFTADEISLSLAECATRVREWGFTVPAMRLRTMLLEWHVWRKINSGEYMKWAYRKNKLHCPVLQ